MKSTAKNASELIQDLASFSACESIYRGSIHSNIGNHIRDCILHNKPIPDDYLPGRFLIREMKTLTNEQVEMIKNLKAEDTVKPGLWFHHYMNGFWSENKKYNDRKSTYKLSIS